MTDASSYQSPRSRPCPACGQAMHAESFARKSGGSVDLDFCFDCQAIWFDAYESSALTPGAVISLFAAIHKRTPGTQRPLAEVCRCPTCRQALVLTHDMQRTNRITYYRCPQGHGRLSTFYQFLREKNFIRSLTPGEIEKLRASVQQVRCTSCGAPINLERDAQCSFCRAPIAILDADAVTRALADLGAEEKRRSTVDPHAAIDAMLAGQRIQRTRPMARGYDFQPASTDWGPDVVDLVGEVVDFFMTR